MSNRLSYAVTLALQAVKTGASARAAARMHGCHVRSVFRGLVRPCPDRRRPPATVEIRQSLHRGNTAELADMEIDYDLDAMLERIVPALAFAFADHADARRAAARTTPATVEIQRGSPPWKY